MKKQLFKTLAIALALTLVSGSVWAASGPGRFYTIDGQHETAPEEYGTGEFLGFDNNGVPAYATWNPDADGVGALYIALEDNVLAGGPGATSLYVVIDTDPKSVNPATSGTGRTNQPTTEGGGATYPFLANTVFQFTDTNLPDSAVQNPAPGLRYTCTGASCSWSSASIPSGVQIWRTDNAGSTEIKIPYTAMGNLENYNNLKGVHVLIYWVDVVGGIHLGAWPTSNNSQLPASNPTYTGFYGWDLASVGISPNAETTPTAVTLRDLTAQAQSPALWLPAALLIVLSGALFVSRRRQV